MKRIISLIITTALMTTLFCFQVDAKSNIVGDVNQDYLITVNDVTLIQKYLANMSNIDETSSDFNGDGYVNIADCTTLQKYLAQSIFVYNGFIYTVDNSNATIIGYNASSENMKIPSTNKSLNHTFVSIGNYAFANKSFIRSVSTPSTITSIGYYAFRDCSNLERVTIANAKCHIDSSSFDGCDKLSYFVQG